MILCSLIIPGSTGEYGVQYLDHKVLVHILCETESEPIRKAERGRQTI